MSQPPTLLTLPPEIRHKILHYAIYIPSRENPIPNVIHVLYPHAFKSAFRNGYKYNGFYGSTAMSSIFVICRLLHDELEEILFKRFIFAFPHYTSLASVQDFTTTISPRACALLQEIAVGIYLDLSCDEEDFIWENKEGQPLQVQEALIYMKKELSGLKKIHLGVYFKGALDSDIPVERRIDEYADIVVGIAMIIAPGIEVVVNNDDHQQCRKDIMHVCFEKVEELRVSSKTNGMECNVKVLKHSEAK